MPTEATQQTQADVQEKITFTPEQQARVDEIIRERMGHAGREAKQQAAELSNKVNALEADLSETKQELAKAKTPAEKKEAKQEIEHLNAQIAEMKAATAGRDQEMERLKQLTLAKDKDVAAARAEALNVRKKVAIQTAAAAQGFLDGEVVVALTENAIVYDEVNKKFEVAGENGQPRLNSALEPMSLEEFFAEYATKKPYLVRGDIKSGAGSTTSKTSGMNGEKYKVEQIFGKESNAVLANKLKMTDPKEYHRLKEAAKAGGTI